MFNRFAREAREVAVAAHEIAAAAASPTVEAEHLLLALTEADGSAEVLADAGLDHDAVLESLEAEVRRSLAAVGLEDPGLPAATMPVRTIRWGRSAKLALELSLRIALVHGDRRIGPLHVLLGVLQASLGTVPRALECAGVDRLELTRRVEAAL